MLEKKDKEFVMGMWDLKEHDIYTDNRNATIIAPNNEVDVLEMCIFLKGKYKINLQKRRGSKYYCSHTLVQIRKKSEC